MVRENRLVDNLNEMAGERGIGAARVNQEAGLVMPHLQMELITSLCYKPH